MVKLLSAIGKWLETNGAAIYATRPWTRYGDGDDIRFTTTALPDHPRRGQSRNRIRHEFGSAETLANVESVKLLGEDDALAFSTGEDSVTIEVPTSPPDCTSYAWCLQLECDREMMHPRLR